MVYPEVNLFFKKCFSSKCHCFNIVKRCGQSRKNALASHVRNGSRRIRLENASYRALSSHAGMWWFQPRAKRNFRNRRNSRSFVGFSSFYSRRRFRWLIGNHSSSGQFAREIPRCTVDDHGTRFKTRDPKEYAATRASKKSVDCWKRDASSCAKRAGQNQLRACAKSFLNVFSMQMSWLHRQAISSLIEASCIRCAERVQQYSVRGCVKKSSDVYTAIANRCHF